MLYLLVGLVLLATLIGLVVFLRAKGSRHDKLEVTLGSRWYGTQSFVIANVSTSPLTLLSVTLNERPAEDCTFFWTRNSDVPVLRSALDRTHAVADGYVLLPGNRTRELLGYACGTEVVSVRVNTSESSHTYTF